MNQLSSALLAEAATLLELCAWEGDVCIVRALSRAQSSEQKVAPHILALFILINMLAH